MKIRTPWRYYIDHAFLAVITQMAVWWITGSLLLGTLASGGFYGVREIYQRITLGKWDWKGLLWPVVTVMIIYIGVMIWT